MWPEVVSCRSSVTGGGAGEGVAALRTTVPGATFGTEVLEPIAWRWTVAQVRRP